MFFLLLESVSIDSVVNKCTIDTHGFMISSRIWHTQEIFYTDEIPLCGLCVCICVLVLVSVSRILL